MIKLKQAVIVEGKYDRIKLSSIIDSTIIETGGFRIFSNKETAQMIKILAKTSGIVIMTDSDFAGFRIRNYIQKIVTDGKIYNAYLPDVLGKEKRKARTSKEGLLGVEGFSEREIINSLKAAGVLDAKKTEVLGEKIEKFDLYELGLSGKEKSQEKRDIVLKKLGLPTHLSPNALICVINSIISKEEFYKLVNDALKS